MSRYTREIKQIYAQFQSISRKASGRTDSLSSEGSKKCRRIFRVHELIQLDHLLALKVESDHVLVVVLLPRLGRPIGLELHTREWICEVIIESNQTKNVLTWKATLFDPCTTSNGGPYCSAVNGWGR